MASIKIPPPHKEATRSGWYLASGTELPLTTIEQDCDCDCLVIGAGWMGLHAARRYGDLDPQSRVILVDAGRIGDNASGRCMGFAIDLAHNPRREDFVENIQENQDELTVNLEGTAYLKQAVEELGVECDWDPQGKYHSAATEHGIRDLVNFSKALDAMGQNYAWVEREEIQEITGCKHYIRALHHPGTILIQPALYLKNMARKLPPNVIVHENTAITSAHYGEGEHIFTSEQGYQIRTKKVILCNAGYVSKFGFYENTAIPVYTFGSMTRQLSETEWASLQGREAFGLIPADSFGTTVRKTRDRRLFLRNTYTYADDFKMPLEKVQAAQRNNQKAFERRWPELSSIGFEASWGGLLTLAQNGGMVFGQLAQNVYAAAFCNGTGVSRGTAFGKSIAELALGQSTPISKILQNKTPPNRTYPKLITAFGVKFVTGHRFRKAGLEV